MGILVKVVDSTFSHNAAIGYAGERTGEGPALFQWDTTPGPSRIKVWTDIRLAEVLDDPAERKIALLVESPLVNSTMYEWIQEHKDAFDAVLTHQQYLVDQGEPFLFYPLGGSWLQRWGMYPKSRLVSMLVSEKTLTEAHKLRHEVAKLPGIDCFGRGVGNYIESKAEALQSYYFSIVIENGQSNFYFTEKLLDCISQGTIPIYRGCSGIGAFFNKDGIIQWQEIDELKFILENLSLDEYERRRQAAFANLWQAGEFESCEDWIAIHYSGLLF